MFVADGDFNSKQGSGSEQRNSDTGSDGDNNDGKHKINPFLIIF